MKISISILLLLVVNNCFCSHATASDKHVRNRLLINIDNNFGYINRTGTIVIQPQFEEAKPFSGDLARVSIHDKWGYIDTNGQFVIKPQFDDVRDFYNDLACIELDGKWGYIEKSGTIVIKPQFDDEHHFSDGLASVAIGDKWGYVDKKGVLVIKPQFERSWISRVRDDSLMDFNNGMVFVEIGDKQKYIDKTGKVLFDPLISEEHVFFGGLSGVKVNNKWGFIDVKGNYVIKPQFDMAFDFNNEDSLADVYIGDKCGCIDKKGNMVIKPQYNWIGVFIDGIAPVKDGKDYGYIDKKGAIVIEPQFDRANKFSGGLASVNMNGKFGYIDKTGEIAIRPQFEEAADFANGSAWVKLAENWGPIDKNGTFLAKPEFIDTPDFAGKLALAEIGYGNYRYIDRNFKFVISSVFESGSDFIDGLAFVVVGDSCGYIDTTGKYIYKFHVPKDKAECDCEKAEALTIPKEDLPHPGYPFDTLLCSYCLYYGIDCDADPVKARLYAIHEYLDSAPGGELGAREMLLTIYANGVGAKRNFDLAMKFCCEAGGWAEAESQGRKAHIAQLKKDNWKGNDFSFYDDITSGYMQGACAKHNYNMNASERRKKYSALISHWSAKDKAELVQLKTVMDSFISMRTQNEVDLSGTARAAFVWEEQDGLEQAFLDNLIALEKDSVPNYSQNDFNKIDARLNELYRFLGTKDTIGYSTIVFHDIKATEIEWVRYRDAWVNFCKIKYPSLNPIRIMVWQTKKRVVMLKELYDLAKD